MTFDITHQVEETTPCGRIELNKPSEQKDITKTGGVVYEQIEALPTRALPKGGTVPRAVLHDHPRDHALLDSSLCLPQSENFLHLVLGQLTGSLKRSSG